MLVITTVEYKETVDSLQRDEYISDMNDVNTNSEVPASILYALKNPLSLRLQLARMT